MINTFKTLGLLTLAATLSFSCFFAENTLAQGAPPAAIKEWTVLVYMNSDNNLWSFGQMNMAQMERVGSSDQVNLIVEQDPAPKSMPTTRYYVTQNPNAVSGKPTSKVLQTLGETDMGDWKHLSEFISWGVKNFPAKRYALIIWNHGAGWQGVSYDDNPQSHMSIPDLNKALKTATAASVNIQNQRGLYRGGPIIDILNFDACIMSTLEVAFEVKDGAKVLIGSQFNEPGEGEDYTTMLRPLIQTPTMATQKFAEIMVYQYTLQYKDRAGINYIAIDLTKIANFTHAFSIVADNHASAPTNVARAIKSAYSQNNFDSDLIGGMEAALAVGSSYAPLAQSVDAFTKMYGYPAESMRSQEITPGLERASKAYRIKRHHPGTVHYRYAPNAPWQHSSMVRQVDGSYAFSMPATVSGSQMQYIVSRATNPNETQGMGMNEASTYLMREGVDPIAFHASFPPTSPVIADSHTFSTKGARGMTLYFYSGLNAQRKNIRVTTDLSSQYQALQFAIVGAPSWTKFLGM